MCCCCLFLVLTSCSCPFFRSLVPFTVLYCGLPSEEYCGIPAEHHHTHVQRSMGQPGWGQVGCNANVLRLPASDLTHRARHRLRYDSQ